jgi:hypothetical protein
VGTRALFFVAAIVLVACGGETDTSAARIADDAGGGRSPGLRTADAAKGAGGTASSTGGADTLGFIDAATLLRDASLNSACGFAHAVCGGLDSYVDLRGDGGSVRLSYPRDAGCGTCTVGACELWSFARKSCGIIAVQLAACAGPGGGAPCLDMASPSPSYTDQAGHVWTAVSLYGSSFQPGAANPSTNVVDLDLKLVLGAGGAARELAVHVHTCGSITATLAPCH